MRGSDKNTRDGRVRVSYVDDAEIIERIEEMAKKRRSRRAKKLTGAPGWPEP